jgi:hypothetical protein
VLVVIALDHEDGDPLLLKPAQHRHRVIRRLRFYVAAVEQVARYDDEVYAAGDGVAFDHLAPGPEEIARPVGQVISFDAEMNVSYVKKSCHMNNRVYAGLRNEP